MPMMQRITVKSSKRQATLPIGRTAKMAFEIDSLRGACSSAAEILATRKHLDEVELEECARLDDALADAQRLLKATIRNILLSRIDRRSRGTRAR